MTERRALFLIACGTVLLTIVLTLALWAVGVRNVGISLGMIVPMVIGGFGMGWAAVHYGEFNQRQP